MPEEYSFSNEFQDAVLASIIDWPDHFLPHSRLLNSKHFQGVQATITAKAMLRYQEASGRFPSWEVLRELVAEEANNNSELGMRDYLDRIEQLDTGDVDYILRRILQFVKERTVLAALKEAILIYNEKGVAEYGHEIVTLLENAVNLGTNAGDLGIILHRDYKTVIDKVTSVEYGIRSGFAEIDKMFPRGWGPGWLIVPLAPPKYFKSTLCANMALNMIGPAYAHDVFYYPCEISQELTVVRILANLIGHGFDYLYGNTEKFTELAGAAIQQFVAGNLVVKGFPIKTATILGDIRNHVKQIITEFGIHPKAIIIDYADTVRAGGKHEKEYLAQASVYVDAARLGGEFKCPVIMPDRVVKSAVDKPVPRMTDFQGAFEKAGIVDVAFGICGTDEELMDNILRLFFFLNRHGVALRQFECELDKERYRMTVTRELPYEPDDEHKGRGGKKYQKGQPPPDLIEE